jgi:ABC-type transport system involved in multi-copper enzyme maturation permease subunit
LLLYFLILPSFNLINNGTLRTLLNFITGNIIYFQSVRFNFGVVPNLSSIDIVYPLIYVLVCYLISFLHFNKYDFR